MKHVLATAACLFAAIFSAQAEAGSMVVDGVTFRIPDDANLVVPMQGSYELGQDKRVELPFRFTHEIEIQGLINDIRRHPDRRTRADVLFMTGIKGDPAYLPMTVRSDASDPIRLDRQGDLYDVGMTQRRWAAYRALPEEAGVSTVPADMYPRSVDGSGDFKEVRFVRTGLDFAPEARISCKEGNTLCDVYAPLSNGWSINFNYFPVDGSDIRERVVLSIRAAMPRGLDGFTQWTASSLDAPRKRAL